MKILICDNMKEEEVEQIKTLGEVEYKPENLIESVKDAEVVVVRSATKITKEVVDNAPNLRLIIRAGVGLDNIDLEYCREKKIKVKNTPGASTNAVAELTIGLIITLLRGNYRGHEGIKNGKWFKKELLGEEISGKTLGIMGYGRIGSLVAKKAHALGMNIVAFDKSPKEDGIAEFTTLDGICEKADIITLHMGLFPDTKEIINNDSIGMMKDGAYMINTARGPLINEDALYRALKDGKLAGAALDVYCEEPYEGKLLELSNVFFSPHLGANTKEAQKRIGDEVIKLINELKKQK